MPNKTNMVTCANCHEYRLHHGRGFCRRCYSATWQNENRDKCRNYWRSYHARDRLASRARSKNYREKNLEQVKAKHRQYMKNNLEYYREWSRNHPERAVRGSQRRRSRARALPATLTKEEWENILKAYKNRCAYCRKRPFKGQKLQQDHILALAKGGGYTVNNIIPACRSCNSKKNAGPPPNPVQPVLL